MIYCFDLDKTLCETIDKNYNLSTPIKEMVDRVNYLYDNGHEINIYTARGMGEFNGDFKKLHDEYYDLTSSQIKKWGIKHHKLLLGKPLFDFFIGDKNMTIGEFKRLTKPVVGFIAGSFDIIHPGYIKMFKFMKKHCDFLITGLQEDPTIEREEKIKPVLTIKERKDILSSIRYVDDIYIYKTEEELVDLLSKLNIDVRFLGDDYRGKKYTGNNLPIKIKYVDRSHGWSTTKLKNKIKNQKQ